MSNRTMQVKANYERIFAEHGLLAEPEFYSWIIGLLGSQPIGTLLDVACGEGSLVREAVKSGLRAYGIDLAAAGIRKASVEFNEKPFIVGDGERLPFPHRTFNFVTCLGSLENMIHPSRGLAEMVRVLKDGGLLCLQLPSAFWLGDVVSSWRRGDEDELFQDFERRATRSAWKQFLLVHGLIIERELRYNRPAVLFRDGKLRSLRKFIQRATLNLLTPFNLSWSFVFICRKGAPVNPPQSNALIWEGRPVQSFREGLSVHSV